METGRGNEEGARIEEQQSEQKETEMRVERRRHVSKVDSVDSRTRSQSRRSGSVRNNSDEAVRESRERNSSTENENAMEISRSMERKKESLVLKNTLAPKVERRGRSASPIWVPGSTSYADILRGNRQSSRSPRWRVARTLIWSVER